MSTTFAVFGGIYSNHLALQAVLDDVKRQGADHTGEDREEGKE